VREHGIPFRTAHGIAARLLKAHREHPDVSLAGVLATASGDLLGVPITYSDAQIAEIMSPRHFVEVRRTHGGPSPDETSRALKAARDRVDADQGWLARTRETLAAAEARLRQRSDAL
jgi:argininosuccinate lyase